GRLELPVTSFMGRDPVSTGPGRGPTSFAGSFSESGRKSQCHFGPMGKLNLCQSDDGDLPAGSRAPMGGVAMGKIALGMGIGAGADPLYGGDAGGAQPGLDEAGQVDMRLAAGRRMELPPAIGMKGEEIPLEALAHLVI